MDGEAQYRRQVENLSICLSHYISALNIMRPVLFKNAGRIPNDVAEDIQNSLKDSVTLIQDFGTRIEQHTSSLNGMLNFLRRASWWSFYSEAESRNFREQLQAQSQSVMRMLSLCGL